MKGPDFGDSGGDTVVVDAHHMSERWQSVGEPVAPPPGYRFGDAVRDGCRDYNLLLDNCQHGAGRIMHNGQLNLGNHFHYHSHY